MKTTLQELIVNSELHIKQLPTLIIERFKDTEIDLSKEQRAELFAIDFSKESPWTEEKMIEKVFTDMARKSYKPANLAELILYIFQNKHPYLSENMDVLKQLQLRILAIGGEYESRGRKILPYYRIKHEPLGSSVDGDLFHYHYPKLDFFFFKKEDGDPYHLAQAGYFIELTKDFVYPKALFLGVYDK